MLKYDTHVYLGPTLDRKTAAIYLPQAYYHPPIKCGDLIKLLRLEPKRVVIIDGIYENVPSVWHKEIMLALDSGVEMFGAASMGALRAAELYQFGMIGVGEIFCNFVDNQLLDDDEVAVLHKGKEDKFAPINDAMVNIRATLSKATELGIISFDYSEKLIIACKHEFYPYRLLQKAITNLNSVFLQESNALSCWLSEHGLVDLKKNDAIDVLTYVQSLISADRVAKKPLFANIPMTKFIASLVDDMETLPLDIQETWLPPMEVKLQALSVQQPLHFQLVSGIAKWLKHLCLLIDDDMQLVDPAHCHDYIKQHDLYSPTRDFKPIEHHPVIGDVYPMIYGLVCLGNITNTMIDVYLPAAAFYFGLDYKTAAISEKNLLRKLLVLILAAHTQLQDKQLKIKEQVLVDHLKDTTFWQRYYNNKVSYPDSPPPVDLRIAIDFVAIYMQVIYVYQGFRDCSLGAAPVPSYFRWIYDAMELYVSSVAHKALSVESHA